MQAALRGINASVVGILIAAFYQPLWTSTVKTKLDFLIALTAFASLSKLPPWIVVIGTTLVTVLAQQANFM